MKGELRLISRFAVGDFWRRLPAPDFLGSNRLDCASFYARCTSRVGGIVRHIGHATGGWPAERLLNRLGLGVNDDTVHRQLKKHAQDTAEPPTVIGIDDWSWRKSQTYGTIIIDQECRAVIDVLDARTCLSRSIPPER